MGPKTYIGDSVFAEEGSFKGEIILTTNNGYADDPRNTIVMGPAELVTFFAWLRAMEIYVGSGRDLPVVGACDPGVPPAVDPTTEKEQTDDGS